MKVCNIRDFPQYPNWDRIKEVYPEAVYIGRANPAIGLPESPLANPFHVGMHGSREQVIQKYRLWLWRRLKLGDNQIIDALLSIAPNTKLVCWCHPKACHGSVVMAAAGWVQGTSAISFEFRRAIRDDFGA